MGNLDQGGIMKVSIREQSETDKATMQEFFADPEVLKELWLPSNADSWIPEFRKSLKDRYVFAFTILVDGEIAGEIGLQDPSICRSSYCVGFAVGHRFWNQGICTEALKQLVRFAFEELKLHKLFGDNDADNPASGRVFEKAGFTKEGVRKEQVFKEGRYVDCIMWGLINPASEDHSSKK
jgi:RimJ/RimL family protein N-acetyltransferase